METGKDGRFYDWHYDYNHNGQLDMNEYTTYQDVTYGKREEYNGYRRNRSSARTVILCLGIYLGVPILAAISPFLGIALMILLAFL